MFASAPFAIRSETTSPAGQRILAPTLALLNALQPVTISPFELGQSLEHHLEVSPQSLFPPPVRLISHLHFLLPIVRPPPSTLSPLRPALLRSAASPHLNPKRQNVRKIAVAMNGIDRVGRICTEISSEVWRVSVWYICKFGPERISCGRELPLTVSAITKAFLA